MMRTGSRKRGKQSFGWGADDMSSTEGKGDFRKSVRMSAKLREARECFSRGEYRETLNILGEATDPEALALRGRAYSFLEDPESALECFSPLLEMHQKETPLPPEVLFYTGEFLFYNAEEDGGLAKQIFEEKEVHTSFAESYFYLSTIAMVEEDSDSAEKWALRYLKNIDRDTRTEDERQYALAKTYETLALVKFSKGFPEEGWRHFVRAFELGDVEDYSIQAFLPIGTRMGEREMVGKMKQRLEEMGSGIELAQPNVVVFPSVVIQSNGDPIKVSGGPSFIPLSQVDTLEIVVKRGF